MAGAGYKLFATGDVLTAAQVNTYLNEQTVMVFADSAARTTALSGVLAEGMMSYLQDTDSVEVYDGTSWTAVGGGSSPLTTKGDLYTFSTVDARLGVGANGTVLTADSAETTGLKWAAASSGAVVQVKSAIYSTSTTNATATYTDTGLSVSITPTSASNKVLVIVSQSTRCNYTSAAYENAMKLRINRDATAIYNDGGDMWYVANTNQTAGGDYRFYNTMVYLDSPASTSALTYKTQQRTYTGAVTCQPFSVPSTITVMEVTP